MSSSNHRYILTFPFNLYQTHLGSHKHNILATTLSNSEDILEMIPLKLFSFTIYIFST